MRRRELIATVAAGLCMASGPAPALTFFSVGTGELDGGYYGVISTLCAAVNAAAPGELRCSPEPTPGSIYNLFALRDRQLDMALVQSDWQAHALHGTALFAGDPPMEELRSVLALYPEPVTLLVRRDAGIASLADLAGRRVDIGHPASGRHATAVRLLEAEDIDPSAFAELRELQAGPALAELCAGRLDATILVTGHPSASIAEALDACDVAIADLTGAGAAGLVAAEEGFVPARIPLAAYPQLTHDITTIGVKATLVARADTPDAVVEAMVATALSALPELSLREPLLDGLDPAAMARDGLTATLHPAAAAAFAAAP